MIKAFLDKLFSRETPVTLHLEQPRLKQQPVKRAYQAGQVNRLTGDWTITPTSTRSDLRVYLRNLRARSRDLSRNNDYVKKFLQMVRTNVVGPAGIRLQVRARNENAPADAPELDHDFNRMVEAAWREWSHKEHCTASGRLSWHDAQKLFVRTLARDGEVLVRKIRTTGKYGFALKFIDVNWLDEQFNHRLPDGNRIIMSVEVDDDDRPVAYWLTPPTDEYTYPGAVWDGSGQRHRVRVPAAEMIHCYIAEDENQTRGVPWCYTAALRLKMLGGYEEAELVAARVGACKGGFFKRPEDEQFTGEDDQTQLIEQVEPGMLQELPPGWEFQQYDPNHPNTNFGAFIKSVLRGVAAGLEVSYTSLANDLESVNYSSIRAGLLEERDVWRDLQAFMIEHFCRPVYLAWLEAAMLTGALPLRAADYERLLAPAWQPRGWAWVDPLKDVQASILAIETGLATRTDVLAEQGEDFAETVELLAAEAALLEQHGIRVSSGTQQPVTPAGDPAEDD
ncbi:MAG TPA: phage portal protein [Blastocatellia bacterium]|nr:phage portal protein [Blastocatellia bacterium]